MHQCLKFIYFGMTLDVFRTVFPSLGFKDCTYSNRHMSNRHCQLLASKQTAVSVYTVAVCRVLNY